MELAATIAEQKAALRKQVLARRNALGADIRQTQTRAIIQKLLALPEYQTAQTVAAYMSIGSEFDTTQFVRDVLATGKMLVLSKVNHATKTLDLFCVKNLQTDLQAGVWNILEPKPEKCAAVSVRQVDFVLVPGVAFDAAGHRIGYGAGYYDKLLAQVNQTTSLIGAAYAVQMVEKIPYAEHDIPVHRIVTNN